MRVRGPRPSLLATGLVLLLLVAQPAHAQKKTEGSVVPLDVPTPAHFLFENPALKIVWSFDLPDRGVQFVRIHFTAIDDRATADYRVLVFDRNATQVAEYPKAVFGARPDLWSGLVKGGGFRVEIRAPTIPSGLSFRIKEYAAHQVLPHLESIFREPDWQYIQSKAGDRGILGAARAVAKLSFIREGQLDACSGFMISDDRLVTNEHCVSSPDVCETAVAIFGYERAPDGSETSEHEARCLEVVKIDQSFDFAILRLDGAPGRRFGTVKLANRPPLRNEVLFLVQHPWGGPKMLSQIDCTVKTARAPGVIADSDFGHTCDTAGGSSGSPVFDKNAQVVGLHHLGFILGNPLWSEQNRAVRMERIFNAIEP